MIVRRCGRQRHMPIRALLHPNGATRVATFLSIVCVFASLSVQYALLLHPSTPMTSRKSSSISVVSLSDRRKCGDICKHFAVSSLTAGSGSEDDSPTMRRRPPPPWPRPSPSATSAYTVAEVKALGERIRKGIDLNNAFKDLRNWRMADEGRTPVPDAMYRAILEHCRHPRPPRAYASKMLGLAGNVVQSYFLDVVASSSAPSALPVKEFREVLQAMSRARDAEGAVALLRLLTLQCQENGGKAGPASSYLDEYLFFLVVRCCCADAEEGSKRARSTPALAAVAPLMAEMDRLRIPKSSFLYSAALKGFGRMQWRERVEALAEEMMDRREEVALDTVALNSLLDALTRVGDLDRARGILRDMAQASYVSTSYSRRGGAEYRPVRRGESGSPSRSTAPPPSRVGGSTGLPLPDQYSYNTVLRALGEKDLGAAIALYRDMRDAGVQPDRVTVNTLVAACAAHGRLDRGLLILESSAVPASVEGYTALISALAGKGELEKARDVLESMRAAGVAPNARTYTALLQGAARAGDMAGMWAAVGRMKEEGKRDPRLRPTVWTYNAVMAALARAGRVEGMLALREEMAGKRGKAGVAPDIVTCNTLLAALLLATDPPRLRQAEDLFMEMLEGGPFPDCYTFSMLLRAYSPSLPSRPPPPRSPVDLLQRLPNALLQPKGDQGEDGLERAAAAVDAAVADAGDDPASCPPRGILPGPDRLLELMASRHDLGLLLDTTAVNSLLLALVKAGALKRALEVFQAFKRGSLSALVPIPPERFASPEEGRPGIPDVITYTILVKGVAGSDNVYAGSKIMQLYREMRGEFQILPDLQLAYALVNSFALARSRVGGLGVEDLDEVLGDLRELGWKGEVLSRLEKRVSSYRGLYSEAWKEGRGGWEDSRGGRDRRPKASDRLFDKYGWNKFDSGYNFFA